MIVESRQNLVKGAIPVERAPGKGELAVLVDVANANFEFAVLVEGDFAILEEVSGVGSGLLRDVLAVFISFSFMICE